MIDVRLRSRVPRAEIAAQAGRIPTDEYYDALVLGPARLSTPTGEPLAVYLPGALKPELDEAFPALSAIRHQTRNRGAAGGTVKTPAGDVARMIKRRGYGRPVYSSVLGALESTGHYKFCRLTAFTGSELEAWSELRPLWQAIARHFAAAVPERYAAQIAQANRTPPEWIIEGTPFTTITVNNTYATGIHVDDGDLDEGFSALAVARRGEYTGGRLVFPEYRIAVDLGDGDLILMDAHAYHSNTRLVCACGTEPEGPCETCGAERVSVVAYFRTDMVTCGSADEEAAKAHARAEERTGVD